MANRIVRLTESDMNRLVKRVIMEQKYDTKCITPGTPKDVVDIYKDILSKGYVCDGIVGNNQLRVKKPIGSGTLYVYIYTDKVSNNKNVKMFYHFKSSKKQKESTLTSTQQLYDIEREFSNF